MNNKALEYLIETSNNIEIGSYYWKPHKNNYQDADGNIYELRRYEVIGKTFDVMAEAFASNETQENAVLGSFGACNSTDINLIYTCGVKLRDNHGTHITKPLNTFIEDYYSDYTEAQSMVDENNRVAKIAREEAQRASVDRCLKLLKDDDSLITALRCCITGECAECPLRDYAPISGCDTMLVQVIAERIKKNG